MSLIHSLHDEDEDFIHPLVLAEQMKKQQAYLSRRQILLSMGAVGALGALSACGGQQMGLTTSTIGDGSSSGACAVIPNETKGPYPLDGSSGSTNALAAIYRNNIIGNDINNSNGVPLQLTLKLLSNSQSCAPVSNAAVYIWHCDQYGAYSGYSSSQNGNYSGKTFCRGIVVSDANGEATFTTLYPGWYTGRITHIHMAIYANNNLNATPKVSQLAFPQEVTTAVYNTAPYTNHGQNSSVASFSADNVFSDGVSLQLATVSGSVSTGLVAQLNVGLS